MTARGPVHSNRRLTPNEAPRITLPGNQQANDKAIDSVLKIGSPEDIIVCDNIERSCELQTYSWTDRHKI